MMHFVLLNAEVINRIAEIEWLSIENLSDIDKQKVQKEIIKNNRKFIRKCDYAVRNI